MKKKKKHIDTFILSKDKKYKFYYKKNFFYNNNELNRNNLNFNKELNFFYGLQSVENKFLTIDSIKAILKLIKWFTRRKKMSNIKFKINIFPDFILTARSKETRMGKGKGATDKKVALVKKNKILIEFNKPKTLKDIKKLDYLIRLCRLKLGVKTKVIKNIW